MPPEPAGLSKTTMIVAIAGIVCLAAASFFDLKWLSASSAVAKQEEQNTLLKQIAPLLQNGKFELHNQSAKPLVITSLGATYLDASGQYKTYNSTGYSQTWEFRLGQRMKLEAVNGTQTVWDGAVIFYAMNFSYGGNEYFLTGTWKNLDGGLLKISLM